jgi:hypothetical protein
VSVIKSYFCVLFLAVTYISSVHGPYKNKEHKIHRVIMYLLETKATSRLPYFGHLPLNTYLLVVCIAAEATEMGGY